MKHWKIGDARELVASSCPPGDEKDAADAQRQIKRLVPSWPWEGAAGVGDPLCIFHETRLNMEVEDAIRTPVALTEANAAAVLDSTQRLREYREREKASLRPIYNFGNESCWSGGGEG